MCCPDGANRLRIELSPVSGSHSKDQDSMPPKILIIDDDSSLRRVLEYNLQQEGYDVTTAADGESGLQLFAEQAPAIVITDLKMPGMGGFQLLSAVKERSPSTVVIVLTAFGAIDTAVEAMKLGAFDYLTKPFNREELKLTVRKALELRGLSEENRLLKEELSGRAEFKSIVGTSRAMEGVFSVVRKVADTEATVLITGESGTGKELVARAVHSGSSRRGAPFVAVNCAAIPRDLLESELFGHLKGAFTGAIRDKEGKFQHAEGGTIFLDEVGDLPLELQPKLLRVLQERVVEPVGGTSPQKIDVRVVAATNADLEKWIVEGKFREDLYYRLCVIPLELPPLRERVEDIPLLVRYFCGKFGAEAATFSKQALERLQSYAWPGNVRELENTVERLLIMRESDQIGADDLPDKISAVAAKSEGGVLRLPPEGYSLEQLEMEVVLEALARCDWNQTRAARFLRIPRHTLIYRMEKYNIVQPGRKS
jgi:DNA-binding NtrC family response regulator